MEADTPSLSRTTQPGLRTPSAKWPGLVPLGVVRPPVLRLGGATKKKV